MIDDYDIEDLTEYQSESKSWLFGIVRQYIIDNKLRNYGEHMPQYEDIKDYYAPSPYHYYSNVVELAFKANNISQKIIDKINSPLNIDTRIGYLRSIYNDPTCHYIIGINTIKWVIDLL